MLGYPKTTKFKNLRGRNLSWLFLNLLDNFSSKMMFSEHAIRVFLENGLGSFIFSVLGRFIEDYLRNLMFWQNSKNRFEISASAPKLIENL
jgi:hypothetical protein